jgi:hypothetical protein
MNKDTFTMLSHLISKLHNMFPDLIKQNGEIIEKKQQPCQRAFGRMHTPFGLLCFQQAKIFCVGILTVSAKAMLNVSDMHSLKPA